MAFSAELSELESLYFRYAEGLFALCFLYTGRSGAAFALMRTALCDLCYSEAQWKLAQGGEEGFFRAVHKTCMDYYIKNPRGKQKKRGKEASSSGAALPFSLTDPLRSFLRLPVKWKTPLYLCLGMGWSTDRAALALGGSPARTEGLVGAALKKLDMPREQAQSILSSVRAGEDAVQRVWDRFLTDRDEQGFEGKQRLRRFKRFLDNAIPYIALGVVALGALAFFGVEYGWFTGVPYSQTAPIEGYAASGFYGNPPAPASETEVETGSFAVYVPEEGAFVKYLVQDAPRSASAAAKQMVYLGGLPEGISLLSVGAAREDGTELPASPDPADSSVFSLTVEFSREAEEYFAAAPPEEGEAMLRAMVRTYGELYGNLRQLRFLCGGEELSAGGLTAQSLLDGDLPVSRTVETVYRE